MDSQWLNAQFDIFSDKSKTDLARTIGLESPAISKILNGSRRIKATEYIKMRRFFGLPVDGEQAVQSPAHTSGVGHDARGASESGALMRDEYSQAPSPHAYNIFNVTEDIMAPDFPKGANVLADLSDTFPAPSGTYVITDGSTTMIRDCEVITGSKDDNILIKGRSPDFDPQTVNHKDIAFIGRVIGTVSKV